METADRLLMAERLNELYALGFASIAALSSVRVRVEDDALRGLIEEYLDIAKAQVRRLESLAWADAPTAVDGSGSGIDDLRHFARELARGLLSKQLELAATNALLRMADRKLEQYQAAGDVLTAADTDARAVLYAGEAEEAGMLESLTRYRESLESHFAHARTA